MEIAIDYDSLPEPWLSHTGDKILTSSKKKYLLDLWNKEKKSWYHHWYDGIYDNNINFFEKDLLKNNGIYILYDCMNTVSYNATSDLHSTIKPICDKNLGKWSPIFPDWQFGDIEEIHKNQYFIDKYNVGVDNPNHHLLRQNWKIVYNGSPYFYIAYTNLVDLNKPVIHAEESHEYFKKTNMYEVSDEMEEWYVNQHPYNSSYTLSGLFKLIIDWDIAYNIFNNRETIANLCHNVMRSVDMPEDVYENIYRSLPETPIAKFLKNNSTIENIKNIDNPSLVIDWFKNKYWQLQDRTDIEENVLSVNDFYYRRKVFVY